MTTKVMHYIQSFHVILGHGAIFREYVTYNFSLSRALTGHCNYPSE